MLGVSRIDHGVRCLEDPGLVEILRERRTPLTVCPLSNVKLRVFDRMEDHDLKRLMDAGDPGLESQMALGGRAIAAQAQHPHGQEGVAAFVGKRQANYG